MNYPSSKIKKFGIIGTSCAGKTTLVYDILHKLKMRGVNADGVLQQDRRFSFERARLEDDPLAQWSFIANQIKAEADMALRPGVEVIVSDRSPLDFYAYYEWQYSENPYLKNMVLDWCKNTFTRLYVLDPLPYVDDGARLNEKGRNEADDVIRRLVEEAEDGWGIPVRWVTPTGITREQVYPDICRHIGDKVLTSDEIALLPAILGKPRLLVGGSYAYNRATKFSDLDVYLIGEESIETGHPSMRPFETLIKDALGVEAEVRQVNRAVAEHLIQQGFKICLRDASIKILP
jgi:nicotinamide riboside kinase